MARQIARLAGDVDILVEFGSGSSRKTSLLIDALDGLDTYIPIDVSESFLTEAAKRLEAEHDGLTIKPLVGDFTADPSPRRRATRTEARLLLGLDHRQSDPRGSAGLPGQCGAVCWAGTAPS